MWAETETYKCVSVCVREREREKRERERREREHFPSITTINHTASAKCVEYQPLGTVSHLYQVETRVNLVRSVDGHVKN